MIKKTSPGLIFLLLLAAITGCSPSVKKEQRLFCNIGIADITPVAPVFLAGFANRSGASDSLHRVLRSKCIVVRNDTTSVCLIFNDLMEIAPEYIGRIKKIIADSTALPASQIFIMSSHSHSTPIMDGMHLISSEANEQYREKTINSIASNAIKVIKDSVAFNRVNLQTATGECYINTNRRSIDPKTGEAVIGKSDEGGCDHQVQVLRFVKDNGEILNTVFNYACHPVTLGFGSRAVSPDYAGMAEETVAQQTGGSAFFMQGAAGDVNPVNGLGISLAASDSEGVKLAKSVLQATYSVDTSFPVFKTVFTTIELPYRDKNITETFIDEQVKIKSEQATEFIHWKDDVKRWGERMKKRLQQEGKLPDARKVSTGVTRLCNTVIFFMQGELFNSYQVALKRKFPQLHILFAGYTNGEAGYVPDGASFKAKGYEVDQAYIYVGEPSPLTSDAENIILTNMEEMVKKVL